MGEFAKLEICEIMGSNRSSGVSSNVSESSLGQQSQEAGFDEKTQQELGVYVYALFSDQEVSPFYIGKGVNNRVFDHLKCALKDEEVKKLKYDKIRGSKKVKHVIVRHGLTEKEAFAVEGALIDILGYIGEAMTNIQGGVASRGATPAMSPQPDHPTVMLKSNRIEKDWLIIFILCF